jgi:hypothetical protein
MSWATVAAFTAAAAAIFTAVLTVESNRRLQREQWRRDTELPILAALLSKSTEAVGLWDDVAEARRHAEEVPGERIRERAFDEAMQKWKQGSDTFDGLLLQAAELEMIAGSEITDAVSAMMKSHESIRHWLRGASGASNYYEASLRERVQLRTGLRNRLVRAARTDLGVDAKRSSWARAVGLIWHR